MSENPNGKSGAGEESRADTDRAPPRRRLLKALAGAGGVFAAGAFLPQKWSSPIVSRVIVPAHAQATGVITGLFGGGGGSTISPGPARTEGLGRRLLNVIIPAANAGADCDGVNMRAFLSVCLDVVGDRVDITVYSCVDDIVVSGQGDLGADGSFTATLPGLDVSGDLTPTGGLVSISGGYPGTLSGDTSPRNWDISVSAGSCAGAPGCIECYYDNLPA